MFGTLPVDGRDSGSVVSEHFDFVDRNSPDRSPSWSIGKKSIDTTR